MCLTAPAATLASTMLATASTNSAIYYWDPQGTTGSQPLHRLHDRHLGKRQVELRLHRPGLARLNWTDGKAACFRRPYRHRHSGLHRHDELQPRRGGFFDGGLSPNACDVTITGSGIINLASGPQALDAHNASDGSLAYLRINCAIAGNGQLYPEGNGQSFLHGTNTFTGGTTLGYPGVPFSGTVNFNNGSAFGTGPITLTNTGTGGALVLEGTSAVTVTNPVSVTSATTNNIVGNAAGLTFSGNWSLGGNLLSLGNRRNRRQPDHHLRRRERHGGSESVQLGNLWS